MREGTLDAALDDLLVVGVSFFLGVKKTEVLNSLHGLPLS